MTKMQEEPEWNRWKVINNEIKTYHQQDNQVNPI